MRTTIDGVPFELGEPFDFSFLAQYGRVFQVFDQQDSGNICFGVDGSRGRLFIKFAGAPTVRRSCTREEAVCRARESAQVYFDLRHDNLLNLLSCDDVGGGVALVFPWTDAVCWGKMYPEQHALFCALPLDEKLAVYDAVLTFHAHVLACGYVPVDFYDGSVLYDCALKKTLLCDIEFYKKRPYYNSMGRMWGSSRFMSPEELTMGMPVDERTCVYVMGATAFELFGAGKKTRRPEDWRLSLPLYRAADRAAQADRAARWPTLAAFMVVWRTACAETITKQTDFM